MKHKHADLIHAWADGAEIQFHDRLAMPGIWQNTKNPSWDPNLQYRIKPQPNKIKYRIALLKNKRGYYTTTVDSVYDEETVSHSNNFVHWLTGWMEYVI